MSIRESILSIGSRMLQRHDDEINYDGACRENAANERSSALNVNENFLDSSDDHGRVATNAGQSSAEDLDVIFGE
ncbi:hypothetical protein ANTQUA_LOCUS10309 [Anthophora quadrimaculata]